ncbi:MAG: ribonuclease III [Actinomycetota bacterium]
MTTPTPDVEHAAEHLEAVLGHRVRDGAVLAEALTHGSYASENQGATDYQRLEFLGDAVLQLAVTRYLYEAMPNASEGEMTLVRAGIVSEPTLAAVARTWGLPDLLRLGRGEELTGGRSKSSILSDVVEALLAAVYLETGFYRVEEIVRAHWGPLVDERSGQPGRLDYKTRLQEVVVAEGGMVEYIVTETGPQHAKEFTAIVRSLGEDLATGTGTSKKRAEQDAARLALERVESRE